MDHRESQRGWPRIRLGHFSLPSHDPRRVARFLEGRASHLPSQIVLTNQILLRSRRSLGRGFSTSLLNLWAGGKRNPRHKDRGSDLECCEGDGAELADVHFAVLRSYLCAAHRHHRLILNFTKTTLKAKRVPSGT